MDGDIPSRFPGMMSNVLQGLAGRRIFLIFSMQTYVGDPSLDWAAAWLQVLSLLLSFLSLNTTAIKYNSEPGPPCRTLTALLTNLLTSTYRVFLLSVIFVISQPISAGVTAAAFLLTVAQLACLGEGARSFPHGFFSLFLPVGHNLANTVKTGYVSSTSGIPEADRQKINHKSLQRRVEKYFLIHFITSLVLLVPYCTLLEIFVQPAPDFPFLLPIFHNRAFTYVTVSGLLVLVLSSHLLYYRTVRQAKQAAKTWAGGANTSLISSPRQSSVRSTRGTIERGQTNTRSGVVVADPALPSSRATSPTMGVRPVSMMYPYLPSAPPTSETIARDNRDGFPGGRKCEEENCVTCAWLVEGPNFRSNSTCRSYKLMTPATCTDTNIVYLVTCQRCQ